MPDMIQRIGIVVVCCLLLYLCTQSTAESAEPGRNTHVGATDFDATLYTKTKEEYMFPMTVRLTCVSEDDTADEWFRNLSRVHEAIAKSPQTTPKSPPANVTIAESSQTNLKSLPVKVAILDTGVCIQHPNIDKHKKLGAIDKARCRAFPDTLDSWDDKNGHGTHVTSVLLQTAPDIDLYIARITDAAGTIIKDNNYQGVIDVQALLSKLNCRQSTGSLENRLM
jgi:subtilisin family serine protease